MKTLAFYSVWGAEYIERFLEYALPTQITEGNLLALSEGSAIKIATRELDVDRFLRSEALNFCKSKIDVEIIAFPDHLFNGRTDEKYNIIQKLQNFGLTLSKNFDAIIFGYADALWSEGSYRNALRQLNAGYDIVLCVGFNVNDRPVMELLDRRYNKLSISRRAISPRHFAKLVCDNLHIMTRSRFWDHPHMNNYPSFVLWNIKEHGILARAFHLHPVIIRVRHYDPAFFRPFDITIDEGLVPRLLAQGAVPYISTSSDEMFVGSLMGQFDEALLFRYPLRPPNIADVAVFGERSTSLYHREFFEHSIRIVSSETDNEDAWRRAEEQADRVCQSITRRLFLPDGVVELLMPIAYAARKERRNMIPQKHRTEAMLKWGYIKTLDKKFLSVIAMHYIDRKGASIMSTLGIANYWPTLRRSCGRFMRTILRRTDVKAKSSLSSDLLRYREIPLEHVLINTNFWQIMMVLIYLALQPSQTKS